MNPEPLQPCEYSLANEARLLRRLIDEASSPSLKQNLTLALAKVLQQDEDRALRNDETLTARAVHDYVENCITVMIKVLRDELPEEQVCRIADRIVEGLALVPPARNSRADLKLLSK